MSPRNQLGWLSLAMFLGMTLWFSATAANAQIASEFALTPAETAWMTMAVQAGFVVGTLVSALLNLPDVLNARRLFQIGCLVGAGANASLVLSGGATSIIALRMLTGAALAWVYPPGMKVAASWYDKRRGAALGVLIGALTVGSAFPHLLAAVSAAVPWRVLMLLASALAVVGGALVKLFVRDGPYLQSSARFDPAAVGRVFRHRPTRLATLGYLGHMWELYAVWTWIAAYASASLGLGTGATPASATGSAIAFTTIASGAIGSAAAGSFADRIGKARIARWALTTSAGCCAIAGFTFGAPVPILALFAAVWGVAVVADSAQLSALVAEHSPRDHVGTALTVQLCAGFLLTMVSIRLIPVMAARIGWQWVFLCLVPGPVAGALAVGALIVEPGQVGSAVVPGPGGDRSAA
ncbi:MAG TPA: MFS transporter [Vicinamibacterales bacterium]|jgi:MFS family permease